MADALIACAIVMSQIVSKLAAGSMSVVCFLPKTIRMMRGAHRSSRQSRFDFPSYKTS
jgi:hypothetical protein